MEEIRWTKNPFKQIHPSIIPAFNKDSINKVHRFHQTIPNYTPSPFIALTNLAKYLGLQNIFVKDESSRFGIQSFKGLGSSYAIAHHLSKEWGQPISSFQDLQKKIHSQKPLTFATATDGNHGRGLAWAAKQLGQNAVVYMPKGSSLYRLNKIKELGAHAERSNFNYDGTVSYVSQLAKEKGWILVQDTAWESYTEIPLSIMQGYLTILAEAFEQGLKNDEPTHVIVQAGVGSFGAAIIGALQQFLPSRPIYIVVEPTRADCFYQSALAKDGLPRNASGDLSTIMAGLSCGVPNPLAWDIFKENVSEFFTCPDHVAAKGMRVLGNPLDNDPRIISGESGSIPLGLLFEIMKNPKLEDVKKALNFNSHSKVFFISTEGDTDPENYRAVCWDGFLGGSFD